MALDGALLRCLREELAGRLSDARIDKIHQPSREELILALRRRDGTEKLYLSARANSPRVHFTGVPLENPASPPMFCMLLRKRLTGGRLIGIRQPGLERALYFDFDCVNDLGDIVRLTLAVEIMGRHSNIILIDTDGIILDAIKRVDMEMSSVRPVLPGLPYAPPPAENGRFDLTACTPEEFAVHLDEADVRQRHEPLSRALLSIAHGLSPLICREIAHQATRGRDTAADSLSNEERSRLVFYLGRVKQAIETGENRKPYILYKPDGSPLEFSFMPITQYGLNAVGKEMNSFSALLDAFYAERDAAERMKQRAHDILRLLTNASDRTARKLEHQREELARSAKREQKRIYADLINANLYAIPRGASSAELINYYDPDCAALTVPLDPALSAAQNAQKYYKEYRKAQTAEQILADQIRQGEEELQYFDTVFDALSRASSWRELSELREELAAGGYLRIQRGKQKPPPSLGPLEFVSDDGFRILVGRNNLQNDRLTLKTARGGDVWFHTKNVPGSHVIVITEGRTPPDRTLEQAAILAASHSRAAGSAQVAVDYTEARHVSKPSGAKPGRVIYVDYRTAYVDPDPLLVRRLTAGKPEK